MFDRKKVARPCKICGKLIDLDQVQIIHQGRGPAIVRDSNGETHVLRRNPGKTPKTTPAAPAPPAQTEAVRADARRRKVFFRE
jgi:hypothetical protein